jgi:hypothetical protein
VTFAGLDNSAANDSGAESTTVAAPPSGSSSGGGGGGGGALDWLLVGWLGAVLTFRSRKTILRCAV